MTFSCTAHLWKGSWLRTFCSVDDNCAYLEGFYHQMTIRCQLKTTVDMARNIHLIMITISTSVIIKISRIVIVMLWILRRSCAVRREWRPTAQIIFPVSTSGQGEEAIVIITAITYIFSVIDRKSEFTRWFDYWLTFSISLQKWIELHFWFRFRPRKVKMYERVCLLL